MFLTVKQAAEATGKSKPTILRAIHSHKISAKKDEVTGGWMIDPAELHRVYPPASSGDAHQVKNQEITQDVSAYEAASVRLELVLQQLETERQERDRERHAAQETIDDLRHRLDGEAEERRKTQAQLTALLTDQRAQRDEPARRSWWRLGKRPA
jgi:excisionase family DNA binding protein